MPLTMKTIVAMNAQGRLTVPAVAREAQRLHGAPPLRVFGNTLIWNEKIAKRRSDTPRTARRPFHEPLSRRLRFDCPVAHGRAGERAGDDAHRDGAAGRAD